MSNKTIAPCAKWQVKGPLQDYRPYLILENLLLFDSFILESLRIREIPLLIRSFGFNGLIALLKSNCFKIYFNPTYFGLPNQTETAFISTEKNRTVIKGYRLIVARMSELDAIIERELQAAGQSLLLNFKQRQLLNEAIMEALIPFNPEEGTLANTQMQSDLIHNAVPIKTATSVAGKKKNNNFPNPNDYYLSFEEIPDYGYVAITDLPHLIDIDPKEIMNIIGRGILSTANLNLLFERMANLKCTSGIPEPELSILDQRLSCLYEMVSPNSQTERFHRVIEAAGMPDLSSLHFDKNFSVQHFLDLRESQPCIDFRAWLSQIDNMSDLELKQSIAPLPGKLCGFAGSGKGKILRWLTSTGIGLAPGGMVLGPLFGIIDTFIIDKIAPKKGPIAQFGSCYNSLFKDN